MSDPEISSKVGREVSCRITAFTISVYQAQGIDVAKVVDQTGYEMSELMNLRRRVPWEVYLQLLEGICRECGGEENFSTVSRAVFSSITDAMARKDQRELNRLCPDRASQKSLMLTQRLIFFSAMTLQSFAKIHALHMKATLSPVEVSYELPSRNELILRHTIRQPYRKAEPFFIAIREVLEQGPASIGVRRMECSMEITDTGATFRIRTAQWPGFFRRLKVKVATMRENAAFLRDYERQIQGELTEAYSDYSQARVDLENLLEATAAGVVVATQEDKRIVYANRVVTEAVKGDVDSLRSQLELDRALTGSLPLDFRLPDDQTFELVNRLPLSYRGEACLAFTVRDVTAERSLDRKIEDALEDERRRLAEDLHDDVGQRLTAARIRIDTLAAITEDDGLADQLSAVEEIVRGALEQARGLAKSLHPETATKADFWIGLQNLIDQGRDAGMSVESRIPADKSFSQTPAFRSLTVSILRVMGEMLTNAMRHADAGQLLVFFDLEAGESRARFGISDDGRGMASGSASRDGIGLRAMQRQVAQMQGFIAVDSGIDGRGTSFTVTIPLA